MATRASARSNPALDPALPQKKRARRRLVGAAAVCLAAAIVLPLVLDSEPRQIRDDVEVRIPSRDAPLTERVELPARGGSGEAAGGASRGDSGREVQGAVSPPAGAGAGAATGAGSARAADTPASTTDADAAAAAAASAQTPAARPEPKPAPKAEAAADPIGKLAEAKDPAKARSGFIVQVGAFSSERSASEQVERARKAGFKAYKEAVKTAQGERVRVRIGPFASRDAADKARAKLQAAGVESVLVAP